MDHIRKKISRNEIPRKILKALEDYAKEKPLKDFYLTCYKDGKWEIEGKIDRKLISAWVENDQIVKIDKTGNRVKTIRKN